MSSSSTSESGSQPTSPTAAQPKALQRVISQEDKKPRSNSFGDSRWRTSSFSEPGRVVLIAVDPSENSKNAFKFYTEQIHRPDDLLVITHIPEPPKLPSFSFKGGLKVPEQKWKEIMDDANAKVSKLESDYETECIQRKLRYKVRGESHNNTGQAICGIAEQEGADLIVMACRGLGQVKRVMLGSVSDYVARHANRPVLIVPLKK